ncbi:hypothetical protein Salat_1591100 [Sesamum alatum]|uniref:Uncharacterized protein n=1 Tax=Sesamum alatum TaxID=300844 RepID=A0AAE2CJ14_9LAMI|nr:hypothetical protein Salat_1591100 [Sesamum alatum]
MRVCESQQKKRFQPTNEPCPRGDVRESCGTVKKMFREKDVLNAEKMEYAKAASSLNTAHKKRKEAKDNDSQPNARTEVKTEHWLGPQVSAQHVKTPKCSFSPYTP